MKIGMAVFSGTGNTALVADFLAEALRTRGCRVDVSAIDSRAVDSAAEGDPQLNPAGYDLFGIGHPVLGFGPTPLVMQFVQAIKPGNGNVFVFKSAADCHPINNTASETLICGLTAKGYDVFHDFLYVMPCNWVVAYPRLLNIQIVNTARERAKRHAEELITITRSRLPVSRRWARISRFFHHLESTYGRKQFGKALRTTDHCTLCGTCLENCPSGNIRMGEQRVEFGRDCLFCMRCVYNCPKDAIVAPGFNWCKIADGYSVDRFMDTAGNEPPFITADSRGYWKHFRHYFGML